MLPNHATRIAVLQARIDAIREIVAATQQDDLRDILLEMLEDGERALAQLAGQSSLRHEGLDDVLGGGDVTEPADDPGNGQ